jgi:(4-(4-[2-(gamma-L-glutamylamino)ethyl]phenoxymethyl)furan-2-yl)methanamine synthase
MRQKIITGWDIGGAHLKAAIVSQANEVIGIYQQPCEMWKGLDRLANAVQDILTHMPFRTGAHVVTMTGELADIFPDREAGVREILAAVTQLLPSVDLIVYAGKAGFIRHNEVKSCHIESIASANWLASATLAARRLGKGIFVDIGSTTTDILPFDGAKVMAEGYSDYERLISRELVYTGIVRTPAMAVAHTILDCGMEVGLMAEYFATMADAYRLTGELDPRHDQAPSADGGEKTLAASGRRIARMLGADYHESELTRWQAVAGQFRKQQLARIQAACERQLSRVGLLADAPVVGAGIGKFLAQELALKLVRPYFDYSGLFSANNAQNGFVPADCAPAAAVAALYLDGQLPLPEAVGTVKP